MRLSRSRDRYAAGITGLVLCGEMYGAPYELLAAALEVRDDRLRGIVARWRRAGYAATGAAGAGAGAPGITAGPVTVRTAGRLRLTPAAKAVLTSIRGARKARAAGLGIVLNALLELPRPDPAAELLTALGIDAHAVQERFAQFGQEDRK